MSTATMNPPLKQVPKNALHVPAGRAIVQFAGGGSANELAITMFARSPEAIDHWYWGKLAHDMQGMILRKSRIPLDWVHDYNLSLGYAERFEASESKGLTVWGKLVSIGADKAAEVIARLKAGIPMEASIDFEGPMRLEEIREGASARCNGRTITGPATIIRSWRLNAVAVCPFGADPATKTQFSASQPGAMVSVAVAATSPNIEAMRLRGIGRNGAAFAQAIGSRMSDQVKQALSRNEPTAAQQAAAATQRAKAEAKFAELKRKGYSDNRARFIAGLKMPGHS
jgi:hypothetical protein